MSTSVIDLNSRRKRIPAWSFSDRIRRVRRDMKMTQAQFAVALGVGEKRYSAWGSGLNTPDDLPGLCVTLERVTGVAREWFLGWADGVTPDGGASSSMVELQTFNLKTPVTHRHPAALKSVA